MKTAFHFCRVRWVVGFLLVSILSPRSCAAAEGATRRGERFDIAEGRLSVILPDGWGKTDLNAADVVAGYATQDNRSSLFIREMDAGLGGGMQERDRCEL